MSNSTQPTEPAAWPPAVGTLPSEVVVAWYAEHRRDLPWRRAGTTAWGVLVSEVMSQQTPVTRVAPAWEAWMRRWPAPSHLAAADTADVLRAWGRLGYPRRALRLAECARVVVERHRGQLPAELDALLALPGVGEYTAGAVLAFAHHRRALVLDTNVRRVLARAVGGTALPPPSLTRAERQRALSHLPAADTEAATWSVAVMELGALVCTVRKPVCGACPWAGHCAWLAAGCPADEHAGRRRTQAWYGTDRQARGLVMAVMRGSEPGSAVARDVLLTAAARAGQRGGTRRHGTGGQPVGLGRDPDTQRLPRRAGGSGLGGSGDPDEVGAAGRGRATDRAGEEGRSDGPGPGGPAASDPGQPARALAGLQADGLIATDDGGATYRLP